MNCIVWMKSRFMLGYWKICFVMMVKVISELSCRLVMVIMGISVFFSVWLK